MFLQVVLSALGTSFLSGIFGMAGGLILMGIWAATLPVATAMVLHGWTQAIANGSRALVHRRQVQWGVVLPYLGGALSASVLLKWISFSPSPAVIYLGLGLIPILGRLLSDRIRFPDPVQNPWTSAGAGLTVGLVQGIAGVAGPLLDMFFVESTLGRREIVATKAATQVVSHLLKLWVFWGLASPAPSLLAGTAVAAVVGTLLGAQVLERLEDSSFRRASRMLVLAIGGWYFVKGLAAF
ncbi:MAG TPA: sulfite exporter TauE/SafE family protein [Myxococcota bacterium]|nr:sulfite exporter TauE/SafE family protein [Myxococcota bacterium]